MDSIRILDSHTGGEPTRLVLEGGPDLGEGPLDLRVATFSRTLRRLPFRHRQRTSRQ